MRINELIIYKNLKHADILEKMNLLLEFAEADEDMPPFEPGHRHCPPPGEGEDYPPEYRHGRRGPHPEGEDCPPEYRHGRRGPHPEGEDCPPEYRHGRRGPHPEGEDCPPEYRHGRRGPHPEGEDCPPPYGHGGRRPGRGPAGFLPEPPAPGFPGGHPGPGFPAREVLFDCAYGLQDLAVSHGFEGNLWHAYLTYLLVNDENSYSTSCEIVGSAEGSINALALHDFTIFKELFDCDLQSLFKKLDAPELSVLLDYQADSAAGGIFNGRIQDRIRDLSKSLGSASDVEDFKEKMTRFYGEFGVGKLGLHKAFRVEHPEGGRVRIVPITNIAHVHLDDLVGYEIAKKKLIDNTEAFVSGRPANNCLLFGDAGTGKSSSVKAILNQYYDRGLRMIEIYKHQFRDLNDVIAQVKNRNYKFIIYMDDLSFEEFETEYKYLKAVIEGGLEKKPENILIYATSNRRHLIRETVKDRSDWDDEIHSSDTMQEKTSLSARFGVTIYYGSPDKKAFQKIVKTLADRNDIRMPENELYLEANKWELSHGGLSGRTAQQFVDYLLGQVNA